MAGVRTRRTYLEARQIRHSALAGLGATRNGAEQTHPELFGRHNRMPPGAFHHSFFGAPGISRGWRRSQHDAHEPRDAGGVRWDLARDRDPLHEPIPPARVSALLAERDHRVPRPVQAMAERQQTAGLRSRLTSNPNLSALRFQQEFADDEGVLFALRGLLSHFRFQNAGPLGNAPRKRSAFFERADSRPEGAFYRIRLRFDYPVGGICVPHAAF